MNTFRWPLGNDGWNWRTNTATMAYAWKGVIAAQADLDVMWSVGLRGLNDYAYPCESLSDCGRQITEAIGNQTQWVTEVQGPDALIIAYMWQEALDLMEAGYLTLPPQAMMIFTDEESGYIRFDPSDAAKYAEGKCWSL